jgi:hypothetical protein
VCSMGREIEDFAFARETRGRRQPSAETIAQGAPLALIRPATATTGSDLLFPFLPHRLSFILSTNCLEIIYQYHCLFISQMIFRHPARENHVEKAYVGESNLTPLANFG